MEEVNRHQDGLAINVGRCLVVVHYMAFGYEKHVAGGYGNLLGIERVLQCATRTKHDENEVHATGISRYRDIGYLIGQYDVFAYRCYALPCCGKRNVGFLDLLFHTIFSFFVCPAFSFNVC